MTKVVWKKILLVTLAVAFLIEFFLTVAGFAAPTWLLTQFKVTPTPDTYFLGFVSAWFMLLVTALCALAIHQIKRDHANGWLLSYLLGAWWIGIGIGIFVAFGRPDNMVLDSLKGAIIVLAAWRSRPQ
jgi:hypothetical protein